MISYLSLENFKLFKEKQEFNFSALNLLTGINGRGKSTLLQSILLFKQSYDKVGNSNHLLLNGDCVELGTFNDVKNNKTSLSSTVNVEMVLKEKEYESEIGLIWEFLYLDTQQSVLGIKSCAINSKNGLKVRFIENKILEKIEVKREGDENILMVTAKEGEELLEIHSAFFNLLEEFYEEGETSDGGLFIRFNPLDNLHKIHYIAADRLGPQKFYKKSVEPSFLSVDKKGNNLADILSYAKRTNKQVATSLHIKEVSYQDILMQDGASTILTQVGNWIGYITDTNNVAVELDDSSNPYISTITFRIDGKEFTPMNIGFGYSYILPVVIAGLIAQPEEILIVENPEAHLHPRAQSRLAQFLARVAKTGIQVFIESHSEHILNALRIATLDKKVGLKNKDVKILYFQDTNENESHYVELNLEKNGKITNWVDGFFDQQEIDLGTIFKLGRNKK